MANFWEEFDKFSDSVGGNYCLKDIYKEKKIDFSYSKIRIKDEVKNLKNQFKNSQKISTKAKTQQQLALSDLTYFVDLINGKPKKSWTSFKR